MRRLFTLCLGTFLVATLAACGGGSGSSSGEETLRVGISYSNTTLDPDLLPIQQMWVYLDPVYDALTALEGDKQVQPRLATEWTAGSEGGTYVLDMKLRRGLEFADGAPFNADTVLANVQRSVELEGSTNAAWFDGIAVEKVAEDEVRFSSATGVGQLPAVLAGPAGMMISQKAIEDGRDLTKETAGIGPFTVKSVQPDRIVYTANKDYWNQDDIQVSNVELVSMPTDAMLSSILAGDVHIATHLSSRMTETATKSGFRNDSEPGSLSFLYAINSTIKPFDDARVRRALSLAIDRAEFCDDVWLGQCTPSNQFFGSGTPYYDESAPDAPYDLDMARDLIKQAGAEGTAFELLTVAGNEQMLEMATYAQAQWTKIGLEPKVTALPPPQVVGRFTQEKNAAVAQGSGGLAFDPSIEIARYVLPDGLYNLGKLKSPEVERLATNGLVETDRAAREAIYKQISVKAVENYLLMPFVTPNDSFVLSPKVAGWTQPWASNFMSVRGVGVGG